MSVTPQITVIVNPGAGYWSRHPRELQGLRTWAKSGVRVLISNSLDDLRRWFADGVLSSDGGAPAVDVVAGGDGTLSQFLSCRNRQGRTTPLLVIPTGTLNVVATDLGLRRSTSWKTLEAIRRGAPWRCARRSGIDVSLGDEWRTGFSFETGFCSHMLRDFYVHANHKAVAVAFLLKTILRTAIRGVPPQDVAEDGVPLDVQSYLASGVTRMVLGLRPFGLSPELPTLASFQMTRCELGLEWWRVVTGDVEPLVRGGALILRPLRDGQTVSLETAEPANLDGEMILAGGTPATVLLRKGAPVDFIQDTG